MTSDQLRIAIIGCGRMGLQHARSVSLLGHRVAVVCDVEPSRAAALAADHPGCQVMTDPSNLRWSEMDAAFICTPPFARGPVEVAAAEAGVPVFLEKPIGLSSNACVPTLRVARARGLVTSVGYMNRYRNSVRRVRQILESEPALGFAAHWVCAAYRVPWWGDPALSGGQINEQCTHLIDLARHLMGEVAEVNAFARPAEAGPSHSAVSVMLRFRSGALGTVICSSLANEKQIGCRVFTPRGQLALEGWDFKWSPCAVFGDGSDLEKDDVFLAECSAFLDAVRGRSAQPVLCDLADAMQTQKVVDAIRASLAGSVPQSLAPERTKGGENHAIGFI